MCCEERPLISVTMGVCYHRKDMNLLERSIKSILEQKYTNIELLICEYNSMPGSREFLFQIAQSDDRVHLIDGTGAETLSEKLNRCIAASMGPYIARMDVDDWSCPDRLEKELAYLNANQDTAFVGCNVSLIQDGRKIGERTLPKHPKVEDFYFTQPYIHPALMFRRAVLEVVGGYSESRDCVLCEDYDLLLRLYQEGFEGANLQECLLDYTVYSDPKGGRKMGDRINEMKTRYRRFRDLGRLPEALPYVIKPVAVGFVPRNLLGTLKKRRWERAGY